MANFYTQLKLCYTNKTLCVHIPGTEGNINVKSTALKIANSVEESIYILARDYRIFIESHQFPITFVFISEANNILVTKCSKSIRIWTLPEFQQIAYLEDPYFIRAVAVVNSLRYIVYSQQSQGRRVVNIWNVKERTLETPLDVFATDIDYIVFSNDEKRLFVLCPSKVFQIWDFNTRNLLYQHRGKDDIGLFSISLDEKLCTLAGKNSLKIYELEHFTEMIEFAGFNSTIIKVEFTNNSAQAISLDKEGNLRIYDIREKKEILNTYDKKQTIVSFILTSDSKKIIFWGKFALMSLMVGKNPYQNKIFETKNQIEAATISKNDRFFVFSSRECYISIINLVNSELISVIAVGQSLSSLLKFDKVSNKMISCSENSAKLWDFGRKTVTNEMITNNGSIYKICIGEDLKYLVSTSYDKKIQLWNLDECRLEYEIKDLTKNVKFLGIEEKGKILIFCTEDNKICMWSITGKHLLSEIFGQSLVNFSFSQDYECLFFVSENSLGVFNVQHKKMNLLINTKSPMLECVRLSSIVFRKKIVVACADYAKCYVFLKIELKNKLVCQG